MKNVMKQLFLVGALVIFFSCNDHSKTLFTRISSTKSNIDFSNDLIESEEFNIMEYLNYYNGGGVSCGDINNDGNMDLYFTSNQGLDRLYLNKGDLKFEDITISSGVGGEVGIHKWTTSATMVDINLDGLLDIYVCEVSGYKILKGKNRLYLNNGDLTFTEDASSVGLDIESYAQQAAFFDYDIDGDLDMFLLNHAVHTPESYKKSEVRNIKDNLAGDLLFKNEDGHFTDVTKESGIFSGAMGYGLSVGIGDLNNDFYPDIYVSNDFHENDYLYMNQQDGSFDEIIKEATGHVSTFSMGNNIADYNNDGWLDIFTLDMKPADETILKRSSGFDSYDIYNYKLSFGYHYQFSRNMLQLNRGILPGSDHIRFSELGQLYGVDATDWSWAGIFADLDNDGWKDILVTNGIPARPNDLDFIKFVSNDMLSDSLSSLKIIEEMPSGMVSNVVFKNDHVQFQDASKEWGLALKEYSNGAAIIDLDDDGDMDIVINNLNNSATLFRNNSNEDLNSNYVKFILNGSHSNKNGIGARVTIFVDGEKQIIENQLTRSWLSSVNSNNILFGIGSSIHIDSAIINWPGGKKQTILDVDANQTVHVNYFDSELNSLASSPETKKCFTDVTEKSGIDFEHIDVFQNDFLMENLIPHSLTSDGPKMSIADINNDGLDDLFVGGAKGQVGAIYLQQSAGDSNFKKVENDVFVEHWKYEDMGSTFFDADGDGDQDLYVVSGGGEKFAGESLTDRLYFNDGFGNFTYREDKLPKMEMNGSCVVPFDINSDGMLDLFIGCRSIPLNYGIPGQSKFLLNNGEGKFLDATEMLLENNGKIGMVTDATWIEERKELIIVGEWMPIIIYSFIGGDIKRNHLDNSAGWWNTIETADYDQDGDLDVLIGNYGLNSDLKASIEEPLEIYIADYDKNLSMDPILAYFKNGKQWVFPDFDLLSKQIIGVKKSYLSYKSFSESTFPEIFPKEQLDKSLHRQVQTLHSVLMEYENGYTLKALPWEAQISPIYGIVVDDFDRDGENESIVGGNFYKNHPGIGKSDASFGTFLDRDLGGNLIAKDLKELGFAFFGEIRDLKIMNTATEKKLLIIGRNNDSIQVLSY